MTMFRHGNISFQGNTLTASGGVKGTGSSISNQPRSRTRRATSPSPRSRRSSRTLGRPDMFLALIEPGTYLDFGDPGSLPGARHVS